jgi:hypothetical protein
MARSSRLAPVDDVERKARSHVDLTEAPLVKNGVTQYEGTTLLLSNMVLRLREDRRAENPQKPARDSMAKPASDSNWRGLFLFSGCELGIGLNPSAQGAAAWRDRVFPRRLLPMTTVSISPRSMKA